MANFNNSTNMNLPIPVVGTDPGPDYALNVNNAFTLVDLHDHSTGKGVPVTPAGLNINSNLPLNNNNLTAARTLKWQVQPSAPSTAADVGCAYVVGVDLYYNDVSGNQVRLTQSGSVAGSNGSISGLSSPASASYVSANSTFLWQSGVSTPANLDAASLTLRNLVASSKGLTLSPPAAMSSNYTITLPTLPSAQALSTIDNAGNMATWALDNSSIYSSSNIVQVKPSGIQQNMLANRSTGTSVGSGGVALSNSCGTFTTSGLGFTAVTNLTVTINTNGRPVFVGLVWDSSANSSLLAADAVGTAIMSADFQILNGANLVSQVNLTNGQPSTSTNNRIYIPVGALWTLDTSVIAAAGTYTYTVRAQSNATNVAAQVFYAKLIAYEI